MFSCTTRVRVRKSAADLQRASRDGYRMTSLLVHVLPAAKPLEIWLTLQFQLLGYFLGELHRFVTHKMIFKNRENTRTDEEDP